MFIADHAFRHYDIRGEIEKDIPLSEIYALGRAIASYILEKKPLAKKIIIGRDGRKHSPEIHRQIVQAFFDAQFEVDDTGICPTPVVYFAAHTHAYDAAVMITASHNGPEYNGFKICLGHYSVWGEEVQAIKRYYRSGAEKGANGVGVYRRVFIQQEYTAYMAEKFSDLRNYDKKILLDCGNGAVGAILRDVLEAVGFKHATILCEAVDDTYPNHSANPVEKENMEHVAEEVVTQNAFFAIGFDGDGDRMAAMTHEGELLSGDILVALFAQDVLTHAKNGTIVYDGKCSLLVDATITQYGGKAYRSPSGHSLIKAAMREQKAHFGGELSCHFFFADSYFGYDDGIYAFLRLVRIINQQQKNLAELVAQFPHTYSTPEIRVFCPDEIKKSVIEKVRLYFEKSTQFKLFFDDGVRFESDNGWGLIRVSHTQPALCIRCEALSEQGLRALKQAVYASLQVDDFVMKELL